MKTWIIFDCHYLCRRAFYAVGELGDGDNPTGTMFGFLQTIADLQITFGCTNPIFCWDRGYTGRLKILPTYKGKRRESFKKLTQAEQDAENSFHRQIDLLRTQYVPRIGYSNNFYQDGYEADDIIASIVLSLPPTDEAIIVSSDQDLYQLLDRNVRIFNAHPKAKHRIVDFRVFYETYGIVPKQWRWVKAIAGCGSDDIPGVGGVGEGTAIQYLKGELAPHLAKFKTIEREQDVIKRNMKLVRLPFPGTDTFVLKEDTITVEKWKALADDLGMASLRDRPPLAVRPGIKNGFGV